MTARKEPQHSAKYEALQALGEIENLCKDPSQLSTVQQVILRSLVTHATERVLAIPELLRVRKKERGVWVCANKHTVQVGVAHCPECGEPGPGAPEHGR